MSARRRVAVIGAEGRLGRHACELLESSAEFELVARIGRGDALEAAVRAARAELAFESTRAGLGFEHAERLLRAGVRPLVATSGVTPEENERLDALARGLGLGGLVVPNFSVGSWLLQRLSAEAARWFERAEIVELHHDKKRDAPSGTALETARRMRAERGEGAREVPIHSVRLPGLYAHQEVLFGAPGEVLTLRHDMSGPDAFGPGILAALRHVATASGVGRGLDAVFARGVPTAN
ncbi:MAG: 4-hydroxy-tetrahydrodipicolinate reductase [Planctomycetes bacterium]|nr:4-hydroxy-tetrahydrodipicolinate reductase [Planctomycetota bacterium]